MKEIQGIANSLFKQLYTCDAMVDPTIIIPLVRPLVSDDMNDELCKPFTEQEISDTFSKLGL